MVAITVACIHAPTNIHFEKDEINFDRIQPESKIDNRPSYGGILEIHFRKLKS